MTRNIGGSILPSAGWDTYHTRTGANGMFQTRPLEELDTHGLYYRHGARDADNDEGYVLIIAHPNGYSCDELAKRIVKAWNSGDRDRAMAQFDYILTCGGKGLERDIIEGILEGSFAPCEELDLTVRMPSP